MTRPFALSTMVSLPFITPCTSLEIVLPSPSLEINYRASLATSTSHPQLRGKARLPPSTRNPAWFEELHHIATLYDAELMTCDD